MRLDPVLVENTRAWLLKAAGDLRAAEVDLGVDPPLLDDAMFHCQQAVEKSMKGFLIRYDRPFRRTHSLAELAAQCGEIDASLGDALSAAGYLTNYAWEYRYPGEPAPDADEVRRAIALARRVHAEVLARLPSGMRP
jgi:HEPN domain-containing protein